MRRRGLAMARREQETRPGPSRRGGQKDEVVAVVMGTGTRQTRSSWSIFCTERVRTACTNVPPRRRTGPG